jgi:histidyl-tRNA synthetase
MSEPIRPIQGTSDFCGGEMRLWQALERRARDLFARYAFTELRTPVMEYADLFTRAVGETTSVVRKEMYAFEKGGRTLALRPEGTAGVMRHAAGLGPQETDGARWYYIGPMFRHERPQAGRKRQFHQTGVECLEPPSPIVDAEILALQVDLLAAWGLDGVAVRLNTRGAAEDHRAVADGLRAALEPRRAELCEDCRRRIDENVLRVLDCKNPACGAIVETLPPVTDFMSPASRDYLRAVTDRLDQLAIPYALAPRLVRGLDYYEHTIWEITGAIGAQDAIAGGGRYRMRLGDRELLGVGFAIGMERVAALLQAAGKVESLLDPLPPLVWLVALGDAARDANFALMRRLRHDGFACRMAPAAASMKSQMRAANRNGAAWAVIRGDDELAAGTVVLKDMADGSQRTLPAADLSAALSA